MLFVVITIIALLVAGVRIAMTAYAFADEQSRSVIFLIAALAIAMLPFLGCGFGWTYSCLSRQRSSIPAMAVGIFFGCIVAIAIILILGYLA